VAKQDRQCEPARGLLVKNTGRAHFLNPLQPTLHNPQSARANNGARQACPLGRKKKIVLTWLELGSDNLDLKKNINVFELTMLIVVVFIFNVFYI